MAQSAYGPANVCSWQGGCQNKVRPELGPYCFHHRRMVHSGYAVSSRNGLQPGVPGTPTDGRGMVALQNRPRLMRYPDGRPCLTSFAEPHTVWWRGAFRAVPFSDDLATLSMEGGALVATPIAAESEGAVWRNLLNAQRSRYWYTTAAEAGVLAGAGEVYEDDAEALAQFDLGALIGGKLVIRDQNGAAVDTPETVEFRASGGDFGASSFSGRLVPEWPATTSTGEVLVRYRFTPDTDESLTDEQQQLVYELEGLRNLVDQVGIRMPENGKLILPRGWIDFPVPRF